MSTFAPLVFAVLIGVLFAVNTARIAARKGRNSRAWGVAGFFLGIFGIIAVAVLPAKTTES